MQIRKDVCWTTVMAITMAGSAYAGDTQIGDFRIGSSTYPSNTAFDPGFTEQTRGVLDAPVKVDSTFTGGSQITDGTTDLATDINLRTFSSVSVVRNLSRFTPSYNGGTSGTPTVGMVQWNFDLTPLDGYLSSNNLALTELDLDLITSVGSNATAARYDVYISYTNPAESIALTSIDNSTVLGSDAAVNAGGLNWQNFFDPARGSSVGDIVNGTHRVLALEHTNALSLNESLLGLYNAGVREFNLQIAAGDFWSQRDIGIQAGSGLSITTEVIPEPGTAALLGLGGLTILFRRRGAA